MVFMMLAVFHLFDVGITIYLKLDLIAVSTVPEADTPEWQHPSIF